MRETSYGVGICSGPTGISSVYVLGSLTGLAAWRSVTTSSLTMELSTTL